MKKRILFVGEHPLGYTGNSHMLRAIISQVDTDKYDLACFVSGESVTGIDVFKPLPFAIIPSKDGVDDWGGNKLISCIRGTTFDILCFVGIDIWRYAPYLDAIQEVQNQKHFESIWIAPYDLPYIRKDWVSWFNKIQFPYIYSEYGANLLKQEIDRVKYFRPPLDQFDLYRRYSPEQKYKTRNLYFQSVRNDQFIFGFIGNNQFRKDPIKVIKAFEIVKKQIPNSVLYIHCSLTNGIFNIYQVLTDSKIITTGDIIGKREGTFYSTNHMVDIYNSIDCLVNASFQEGLSWTLIEAMLCGVPIIATDTTAQTELVENVGTLVPCKEPASLPVLCEKGDSWIDTYSCKVEDLANAMIEMATDGPYRDSCIIKGLKKGIEWIEGVHNINHLLGSIQSPSITKIEKIPKILFAQHGNAGDVLMSTQCFKGIKERHPGMDLIYMTQLQFKEILVGNPYINEIINWDQDKLDKYEVLYNPHGEKILPGGWNNLDTKLADMYPYFCRVKADDMFIQEVCPHGFEKYDEEQKIYTHGGIGEINLSNDYIVIHTTGGQAEYRTYQHMDMVLKGIDIPIIQVGGKDDYACQNATIDLRGKLSWRETAWVMKRAKCAIVIDSFPSHLAGALGTPVIVLFGPAPARVTGPIGKGTIVNMEPNKLDVCPITSNCWGNFSPDVRKCTTPCINTINPLKVRKELEKLL